MSNVHPRTPHLLTLLLLLLLALAPNALAQEEADEWEYLVVSYGTTYFSDPLIDLADGEAAHSKVLLFSELGVTIPNEAATLQRNIDILGRFGWELVTVVGSIGGDQQLVFKRPFDEERSSEEAERITEEREALLAEYNATREVEAAAQPDEEAATPELVDLDALERRQAIAERDEANSAHLRSLIQAASQGHGTSDLTVTTDLNGLNGDPESSVRLTLDVTDAALVGEHQYRASLVDQALEAYASSLSGAFSGEATYCLSGQGDARVIVTASITHADTVSNVGSLFKSYCYESK